MKNLFLILVLILSICSCHRTNLNRFIIDKGYIKIFRLVPMKNPENYSPQPTFKLVETSFNDEPTDSVKYLGFLHLDLKYVSDSTEQCNVPFEGQDGRLDSLININNLVSTKQDSSVIVYLHYFDEIHALYCYKSGRNVIEKNIGFNYLNTFYTFDEIITDYNNIKHRLMNKIAYPIFLNTSQVAFLKKSDIRIKTNLKTFNIKKL